MATNFGMYSKSKDWIHEYKCVIIERLNQGVERFCKKIMKFCFFFLNLIKKQSFFLSKDKF